MNINLLPLFASNVFYFNIDDDTSELDPNDFEFLQLGGNNFASSMNTYSTESIRVLEKYPNTKKILLDKFYFYRQLFYRKYLEILENVLENS